MILDIIDVEHGACALITTSNNKRVMIDCGHNATKRWYPGDALLAAGIFELDRLFITNYDEDHVSGYPNLMDKINVKALSRNSKVSPGIIRYLKSEDGMGAGIDLLVDTIEHTFTGGPLAANDLDYGDVDFKVFSNAYGSKPVGFDDENNLSLVVFVTCGSHRIIFPGDMEKEGWLALLKNPDFVEMLRGVTLFVASHHGRQNGYCEEVFRICKNIELVIISDQAKQFQTQEFVHLYRQHACGISYEGNQRYVLTTRNDGSMKFVLNAVGGGTVNLQQNYAA